MLEIEGAESARWACTKNPGRMGIIMSSPYITIQRGVKCMALLQITGYWYCFILVMHVSLRNDCHTQIPPHFNPSGKRVSCWPAIWPPQYAAQAPGELCHLYQLLDWWFLTSPKHLIVWIFHCRVTKGMKCQRSLTRSRLDLDSCPTGGSTLVALFAAD